MKRSRVWRWVAASTLSVVSAALSGCGDGSPYAPVSGQLSYHGKPVEGASVMLRPVGEGRPAWAKTDSEGRFDLQTAKAGDGALIGSHKVSITAVKPVKPSGPFDPDNEQAELLAELHNASRRRYKREWIIPEKFSNPSTSGLTFEVVRGENTLVLDLE